MYGSKMKSEETDHLFEAILSLKDLEECYRFFDDLCTFSEIQAMTQRLQVAEMLEAGNTFSQISKEIGVSSATITRVRVSKYVCVTKRVNKCISYGADGYKIVLKRMKEKNAHE